MATGVSTKSAAHAAKRGPEFLHEVEAVSRRIRDPAAKLRYLRASLAEKPRLEERLNVVPGAPVRRALYRWASLEQMRKIAGESSVDPRVARSLFLARGMGVLAAAGVLAAMAGALSTAFQAGARVPFVPVAGAAGMQEPASDRPVGILFHTTESDIWPLEASFNENLRGSSQRLLRYLKREQLYHYLIDRFGRVFRVVDEDAKANHAGQGTWSDGQRFYLSLNNAFLGVSFETRWEAGRALPITEAQLTSGRGLTDYLRQRYDIRPEMCATHGLTSLNGRKHLIGHHLDWARGFPFAAFGLPDQYARTPPNVAYFGFGYDETLAERMGEPWPGVAAGELAFARTAREEGIPKEALRRQRQDLYDRWQTEQLKDEEAIRAEAALTTGKASGG